MREICFSEWNKGTNLNWLPVLVHATQKLTQQLSCTVGRSPDVVSNSFAWGDSFPHFGLDASWCQHLALIGKLFVAWFMNTQVHQHSIMCENNGQSFWNVLLVIPIWTQLEGCPDKLSWQPGGTWKNWCKFCWKWGLRVHNTCNRKFSWLSWKLLEKGIFVIPEKDSVKRNSLPLVKTTCQQELRTFLVEVTNENENFTWCYSLSTIKFVVLLHPNPVVADTFLNTVTCAWQDSQGPRVRNRFLLVSSTIITNGLCACVFVCVCAGVCECWKGGTVIPTVFHRQFLQCASIPPFWVIWGWGIENRDRAMTNQQKAWDEDGKRVDYSF